ncbi:hypothetical protein [Paenibacillus daejeonensis]|uniref:hypothetical protein n=1 Tax=Paenibacillus daejeonensis TaxID=135193 RepID=UPI00036D9979|nr:hypothetical protein [Paenibacillus daejeonensis]
MNNTTEASTNTKRRRGPPLGSRNALGNRGGKGGPAGNKHALRTGEHETIWFDTLDSDELDLLPDLVTDPLRMVEEAIVLFTIRERRMMQRIKRAADGLSDKQRRVLQGLRTVKDAIPRSDGTGKVTVVTRDALVTTSIEETTFRRIEDVIRLEEALTRIQEKKLKAIDLKAKLL